MCVSSLVARPNNRLFAGSFFLAFQVEPRSLCKEVDANILKIFKALGFDRPILNYS
jgi:hypothetical protein